MRHRKHKLMIGNTSSRRAFIANGIKALIINGSIKTTLRKGKALKSYADQVITHAKKETLCSKRRIKKDLMLRYNKVSKSKSKITRCNGKIVKELLNDKSNTSFLPNDDRKIFTELKKLSKRFENRNGGYTRIVKLQNRRGDNVQLCRLEYLPE